MPRHRLGAMRRLMTSSGGASGTPCSLGPSLTSLEYRIARFPAGDDGGTGGATRKLSQICDRSRLRAVAPGLTLALAHDIVSRGRNHATDNSTNTAGVNSMNKPELLIAGKSPFAERYDNFIGGQWVAPRAGQYFDNISPVTGQVVCKIARSDAQDIEAALDAAHAAKDAWGRTSVVERALVLNRIADRMEAIWSALQSLRPGTMASRSARPAQQTCRSP
jgi:hypothetical protein